MVDPIQNQKNYENFSREQLSVKVAIAIKTAFIHPLAEFEKAFGDLWGEHLDEGAELTPEQQKYDEMYEKVRKKILDNGNDQIRKLSQIFQEYEICWKRMKP